jgi:hypothetical protein
MANPRKFNARTSPDPFELHINGLHTLLSEFGIEVEAEFDSAPAGADSHHEKKTTCLYRV